MDHPRDRTAAGEVPTPARRDCSKPTKPREPPLDPRARFRDGRLGIPGRPCLAGSFETASALSAWKTRSSTQGIPGAITDERHAPASAQANSTGCNDAHSCLCLQNNLAMLVVTSPGTGVYVSMISSLTCKNVQFTRQCRNGRKNHITTGFFRFQMRLARSGLCFTSDANRRGVRNMKNERGRNRALRHAKCIIG